MPTIDLCATSKFFIQVMPVTLALREPDYLGLMKTWLRGSLVMSHSNLTDWIETADARACIEAAKFEPTEGHHLHLGEAIAKIPSWLRHGVSRKPLLAIGCHALTYVRHPISRTHH
jgi:hypothetical protein